MAELRFDVLFEPQRTGETVADVCRRYGISRDTYYRYRRRYLAEGIEGLEDRSRKPKRSPARIPAEVEIRIVEMRTAHHRWGARRIRAELTREGLDAPAVSTVHQGIDDATPAERYEPTPPPAQIRLPDPAKISTPHYPPHTILRKVTSVGNVGYASKHIQIGYRWAGATVRVIHIGEIVHIYYGDHLIRSLTLHPDTEYQPLKPAAKRRSQRKTA